MTGRIKKAYNQQKPQHGGVRVVGQETVGWRQDKRMKYRVEIKRELVHNLGRVLQPHGQRERLRRMVQIAMGQCKAENGYAGPPIPHFIDRSVP